MNPNEMMMGQAGGAAMLPQPPMAQAGMPSMQPPQQQAPMMMGGQMPQAPEQESEGYGESDPNNAWINKVLESSNLAEEMDEEELTKIGATVCEEYDIDCGSRKEWMRTNEDWIKLATQVAEKKNHPWPNAANVKYPLVTTAAMQFGARAYPSLLPGLDVVRMRVIGGDDQGLKAQRASRVEKHMSYQVLEQMESWEEDMDKLCMITSIVGATFKKTWYDTLCKEPRSELVHAKDLVVNYYAPCLEEASRVTHVLYKTPNQVKEKQNAGIYLDTKLQDPHSINPQFSSSELDKVQHASPPSVDKSSPYTILEQHRWLDIDEDGYEEPYIVTVEYESRKVLRIVARFEEDSVEMSGKKIVKIKPTHYFTMFPFIPNPDGGFYPLGFGALLGPLNETVNTLINQLLDAGTMRNLQAGFLSKGVRMKGGVTPFKPGEWKVVQSTGDDLKKGIVPLPANEPSTVLFQLLGTIVQSGKELASIAEIFVGKMPGQNTPATTTMATVEQGMKVFTAIYKRLFRSLKKEFQKLFRLNSLYLDEKEYFTILDTGQQEQISGEDYKGDVKDIRPAADPQAVSELQKLAKAQMLLELIPLGTINKLEATVRVLQAGQHEELQKLLVTEPAPDPEMMKLQGEMQMQQQEHQLKMQEMQMEMEFKQKELEMKLAFETKKMELDFQKAQMQMQVQQQQASVDIQTEQVTAQNEMQLSEQQHELDMQMAEDEHHMAKEQSTEQHSQKMEQGAASHQQKMKQTKEQAKVKPKTPKK
jgi:chaperonin GroES